MMKQRFLCLLLSLSLLLGLSTLAFAADADVAVLVDGASVTDARATAYNQTTYVSLPLVALALRPDATAAWENDRMVVRGDDFTISAKVGHTYLVVNGRYLYIPQGVKQHDTGDTLVPVRVLAKALGAEVSWDGAVQLTAGDTVLESGDTYYNASDVDLLARVIYHESGNQPFRGQIAVGNVILNRVAHKSFPKTIYDVIYQKNQFPGATSKLPDAEAIIAAKLCLDGAVVLGNAYWFNGAGKACWASKNKTLIATIEGHSFYG